MPQSWDMGKILLLHLKFVRKIKTHILYSTPPPLFFKKMCRLWDNRKKKHGRDRQATDGNMAHAHGMLDN